MIKSKPRARRIPFGVLIHITWPMGHIVCRGQLFALKIIFFFAQIVVEWDGYICQAQTVRAQPDPIKPNLRRCQSEFISQSLIVISPAHGIFKLKEIVRWLCKVNIGGKTRGRTYVERLKIY